MCWLIICLSSFQRGKGDVIIRSKRAFPPMHFGKRLLERRHPPWSRHYLDYAALKAILEEEKGAGAAPGGDEELITASFRSELDGQVAKVALFYLATQGSVADRIARLAAAEADGGNGDVEAEDGRRRRTLLADAASDLRRLIEFAALNVTAVRKILKKHDRVLRGERALTQRYLIPGDRSAERWAECHAPLRPLLEHGGLDAMALSLEALAVEIGAGSGGGEGEDDVQSLLASVRSAREELRGTSEFVHFLAAQMLLEEGSDGGSREEEEGGGSSKSPKGRAISNWLNYCSTFLHLADYYVVAPGCGSYARRMGGDAALAGVIIGANSIAALASTLLYSWWTSRSYRSPLLCATLCQVAGLVVYSLALPLGGSLRMVLVGRLLSGFGSARSLNRRYIADTFPRAERTAASAAFVTAGALGTSAGPALAAGMYQLGFGRDERSAWWVPENAPCWTMAIVWVAYGALVVCFFEEPRVHGEGGEGEAKTPRVGAPAEDGERRKLLANDGDAEDEVAVVRPLWENATVMLTFLVYFVLKFILESVLSSSALLTEYYFAWEDSQSGKYLALLGLLVLPANWAVAFLSRRYDDCELIVALEICMLVGCLSILDYSANYSVVQYMVASIAIFVSTNALEGPTMSLLSKAIPAYYRRGFWNVGLLATESGTLGRGVGDVILTACASGGLEYVLNNAFGLMAALSLVTIVVTRLFYSELLLAEKD